MVITKSNRLGKTGGIILEVRGTGLTLVSSYHLFLLVLLTLLHASNKMTFFCVYCKTRKKFDKFIKVNKIKNKYIIDIKKIVEEEEVNIKEDRTYLKILISIISCPSSSFDELSVLHFSTIASISM